MNFAQSLIDKLRQTLADRREPYFVGIDGRSGTGKSTLAAMLSAEFPPQSITIIEGDQFYTGGSNTTWDARSAEKKVAHVIDWRRQRQLLLDLRANGTATYQSFDWESDDWDADIIPLNPTPIHCTATPIVLLEGAYSCRPALADLLDLRVLLDMPTEIRRAQLLAREGEDYRADWEARWSEAEGLYFGRIMPPQNFDLILRPYT